MAAVSTLAAALVAAQAEMPAVEKDAVNPHFKSKFTSLDHLIAKTRPVLTKHGLAITQWPTSVDGKPALRTKVTHTSGESDEDVMLLLLGKQDMQGLGGAITYGKRYMWAAVCAVSTDEDDDGNLVSNGSSSSEAAPGRQAAAPEPLASAAEQKKLDRLITNLATANASKDWASIADKYIQREFQHGRDQLTKAELPKVVTALETYLGTLGTEVLREAVTA